MVPRGMAAADTPTGLVGWSFSCLHADMPDSSMQNTSYHSRSPASEPSDVTLRAVLQAPQISHWHGPATLRQPREACRSKRVAHGEGILIRPIWRQPLKEDDARKVDVAWHGLWHVGEDRPRCHHLEVVELGKARRHHCHLIDLPRDEEGPAFSGSKTWHAWKRTS